MAICLCLGAGTGQPHAVSLPRAIHDTDPRVAAHVLNRLGFGPRPADVPRVAAMGVRAYIEQQLHPGTLPDPIVDERLAAFPHAA